MSLNARRRSLTPIKSTNFNPYDVGIVDAIAQTLLPGVDEVFANGKFNIRRPFGCCSRAVQA